MANVCPLSDYLSSSNKQSSLLATALVMDYLSPRLLYEFDMSAICFFQVYQNLETSRYFFFLLLEQFSQTNGFSFELTAVVFHIFSPPANLLPENGAIWKNKFASVGASVPAFSL